MKHKSNLQANTAHANAVTPENTDNSQSGLFELSPLFVASIVLFVVLFGGIAFGNRQFFLRDSGFFYYPLFQQIQDQWSHGELPLWDPCENMGQPLLANPTSSVFYPGKLVFFLSTLGIAGYDFCFKWYILLHIPLACLGMYRFARYLRFSRSGSALGAFTYTWSAPIVALTFNPVFLVGAAWFPWAMTSGLRTIRERNAQCVVTLALVLSLMLLGGDPQLAYVSGLILVVIALFARTDKDNSIRPIRRTLRSVTPPFIAFLLAGGLCAVQILPAMDLEKQSDRAERVVPQSLWEIPRHFANHSDDSENGASLCDDLLCRRLDVPGHHQATYRFSMPPWRLAEFFIPYQGEGETGANARLSAMLPGDDQRWIPDLYTGFIPFLLALFALSVRTVRKEETPHTRERARIRNIASITLFLSIFASFGGYGPCWLTRVVQGGDATMTNGDPVGGAYWFMNTVLPKFSTFRYPMKMMTPGILALATLVVCGWDRLLDSRRFSRPGTLRFLAILAAIPACLWLGSILLGPAIFGPLVDKPTRLGTPFDAGTALRSLQAGLLHLALVATGLALAVRITREHVRSWLYRAVFVLVALDLAIAHARLTPTIEQSQYAGMPLIERSIAGRTRTIPEAPVRVYRRLAWNPVAVVTADRDRAGAFRWDRKTLAPKFPYPNNTGVANVYGTVTESGYARLLKELDALGTSDPARFVERLADLGVEYLVAPWEDAAGRSVTFPQATRLDDGMPGTCSFQRQFEDFYRRLNDDWPIDAALWQLQRPVARLRIVSDGDKRTAIRVLSWRPSRIVWEVSLEKTATIVAAEQYWPGWYARAVELDRGERRKPVIERYHDGMRKLTLPPGRWRVTMYYSPRTFWLGLTITLAFCAILTGWGIGQRWRRGRGSKRT